MKIYFCVSILVHFQIVIIVCWGGRVLTLFYQPLHLASHKILYLFIITVYHCILF